MPDLRTPIDDPPISQVENELGETTLYISDSQAMQGWERELMIESAEILCGFGSRFLEAGLGMGFSALHIAGHPRTHRHTVVEKYHRVVELFQERHRRPPATLRIVTDDFFTYIRTVERSSLDGIFFDPALPMSVWNDYGFWVEVMPWVIQTLRPGGAFIPFFSTEPVLRRQYLPFFNEVIVRRRAFSAYSTTMYTRGGRAGEAYIQCFVRGE